MNSNILADADICLKPKNPIKMLTKHDHTKSMANMFCCGTPQEAFDQRHYVPTGSKIHKLKTSIKSKKRKQNVLQPIQSRAPTNNQYFLPTKYECPFFHQQICGFSTKNYKDSEESLCELVVGGRPVSNLSQKIKFFYKNQRIHKQIFAENKFYNHPKQDNYKIPFQLGQIHRKQTSLLSRSTQTETFQFKNPSDLHKIKICFVATGQQVQYSQSSSKNEFSVHKNFYGEIEQKKLLKKPQQFQFNQSLQYYATSKMIEDIHEKTSNSCLNHSEKVMSSKKVSLNGSLKQSLRESLKQSLKVEDSSEFDQKKQVENTYTVPKPQFGFNIRKSSTLDMIDLRKGNLFSKVRRTVTLKEYEEQSDSHSDVIQDYKSMMGKIQESHLLDESECSPQM